MMTRVSFFVYRLVAQRLRLLAVRWEKDIRLERVKGFEPSTSTLGKFGGVNS